MPKQVQWFGSKKCDICGIECEDELYDAVTKYGPWATMCKDCFKKESINKLGTGYGQHYVKNEEGKFMKVEG